MPFQPRFFHKICLAVILILALYLRLDNLEKVQRWTGDQGIFYTAIMDWQQDGTWPLLGVRRGMSGDFTIGPGFYYLIAPALMLSKFDPAAGAAVTAILSVFTIFFYWLWIASSTGSALAALATAAIFAFGPVWVANDRVLWNPNILPFGVAAIVLLIDFLPRRPVPCLFLFLILAANMPHWHTTAVPVLVAALPPMAWAVWRERRRLRAAPRRSWLKWSLAFLFVMIALYLPPILYELKPGPGNLRTYLSRSMLPSPPWTDSVAHRVLATTERMVSIVFNQTFFTANALFTNASDHLDAACWILAALVVLIFFYVYGRMWLKNHRSAPLAPAFLAFIVGGFWIMMFLKGGKLYNYFFQAAYGVPVLLAGWSSGHLLRAAEGSSLRKNISQSVGLFMVVPGLTLVAHMRPFPWVIPNGSIYQNKGLADTRKIAEYIARDARGKPSSLLFTDEVQNSRTYLMAMVRIYGSRMVNTRQPSIQYQPTSSDYLGKQVYLVVRGRLNGKPEFRGGPAFDLGRPYRVADGLIYRVPVSRLPANLKSIWLVSQRPNWFVEMRTK